ncbi:hypothetical protein SeMB42_g00568 [Synchytrium endobioticum]|uniref:Uncharacterized protein n=1 Tax=Synchytrium endobioticum TaxID=286115 RepID=A0A507DRK0_9FUNG|nr:hypothetical protein SeLEV6574_g01150 [Synchytrium endobioticum]TPX53885.1 hypothetical protein SeMB42_g00568 [Synchytrium endobioticum]
MHRHRGRIQFPNDDAMLKDALVSAFGLHHSPILVPVARWGNFIPALNEILLIAGRLEFDHILYQSVEASASKALLDVLQSYLDEDTLVVGKCFKDHQFQCGPRVLNGVTAPWNTLALWSVKKLALTGFLLVAEGLYGVAGGVEEVSVIALHQTIRPTSSKAKLIKIKDEPVDCWTTDWTEPGRREWHATKMASKISRPAAHVDLLNLGDLGVVEHIEH